MISVDTILLLQQKVESAVQKIEQLKSENDALRAERSELTKALSEKTELLSRFSADEKKIEDGILGALTRLDAVENAIIDSSGGFSNAKADCNTLREQQAPLADSSERQAPLGVSVDPAPAVQADFVQQQEEAAAQNAERPEPLVQPMQAEPQAAPVQEQASFTAPVQQAEAAPTQNVQPAQEQTQNEQTEGGDLFGDTSFETQEESDPDIF